MIIANPIYNAVFKRMMEYERVAKFFNDTLLNQTIEAVQVKPQKYTYEGKFEENNPKKYEIIEERIKKSYNIWVYHLDFIATIKTETGELKKIIIEIQKARNQINLIRYRNYSTEQYKNEDVVNHQKTILPITTILGINLSKINSSCIKVERNYKDFINNKIIHNKNNFFEKLTHDSFI